MTSRLCSITSREWPAAQQPLEGPQQGGDVVEVQAGGGLVEQEQDAASRRSPLAGVLARWPASLSRWASPPDRVGTGWPSRR